MPLTIKQLAEFAGHDRWKWSVWLEGSQRELSKVQNVKYHLHPSYKPATRLVKNRRTKFRLNASGSDEFLIRVDVYFDNGKVKRLEHELRLPRPKSAEAKTTPPARDSRPSITQSETAQLMEMLTVPPAESFWLAHFPPASSIESLAEAFTADTAHVTFIHGIANKLSAESLLRSWLASLADAGGIDFHAEGVSASMVYWADVLYADPLMEMVAMESATEAADLEAAGISPAWELALPPQEQFFVESLRSKMAKVAAEANPPAPADAASTEERIPLPWFIKRPAMEALLRDVHHYLFNVEFSPRPGVTYKVRDEIRRRFITALQGVATHPHIVVSHSMGTVVAYDCLKRVPQCPAVDSLMTIGSPLGLDEVQDMLRPEWTRRDGFPGKKIKRWTNVFDALDPVAGFDAKLANDYLSNGQRKIEDIHEANSGWWRHNIDNYLRGPLLRQALRQAIRVPSVAPATPVTEEPQPAPQPSVAAEITDTTILTPLSSPDSPTATLTTSHITPQDTVTKDPIEVSPLLFFNQLRDALDAFDHQHVTELSESFVKQIRSKKSPLPAKVTTKILDELCRKRHFRNLRLVADALLEGGESVPKVRRLYVQALIDEGDIAAGLAMAQDLAADAKADSDEAAQAKGLVGRAYKQWYVQSGNPDFLRAALDAYFQVFKNDKQHLWFGINIVALLARAERDHWRFDGFPYYPDLAKHILGVIEARDKQGESDKWDRVTAMEANVALKRTEESVRWARDFVHSEGTDAFELASTVRQLKQVWQLTSHVEPGSLLMPFLEAELLKRKGGQILLPFDSTESAHAAQLDRDGRLEKVFGADSYNTYQWYMEGFECFRSVARIETFTGQGMGTGFLISGNELGLQSDELLLLTNAHVISEDKSFTAAFTLAQAHVNFQALKQNPPRRYAVREILGTSRPGELDFTLCRLEAPLTHTQGLRLSQVQPNPKSRQRLYAIGHPLGGGLTISIHDNLLIDFKTPLLHYRTPTDPGSSGSPIFDDQWRLIALHHSGGKQMPRLTAEGSHEANEGIWLSAIRDNLTGSSASPVTVANEHTMGAPAVHVRGSSSHQTRSTSAVKGTSMNHNTKKSRLEQYVKKIAPADGLESMKREPSLRALTLTESLSRPMGAEPTFEAGQAGLEKLERGEDPTEHEMLSIEAIVLPRERPVVFIEDNSFSTPETPWEHFATDAEIRGRIEQAIPSIGRVELPNNLSIPFGGTAFVVGDDLLMTNRHVAELFASGLGMRNVMFRPGQTAGWDHMRERTSLPDNGTMLEVKGIVMIHPFWDMALLRVAGLNASHSPLRLSVTPPEELVDHDVAVIGYPAKDWRNDSELQDRIFGRVFNVKRLQPGKIKPRASIRSFENNVSAMTHDSSTLGGNSGSAIVDARTGDVVGLHFAGQYLLANYGVPTYELARDQRIVDLGVKFAGSVSPDSRLTDLWRRIEPRQENLIPSASTAKPAIRPPNSATTTASVRFDVGDVSFTIPVQVSVTSATQRGRESVDGGAGDFLEAMKEPIVARHLDKREGYDPAFLELDDDKVIPLPKLTATGEKIVARIDGETPELKYHKFSIVMHKKRRLALFTASNVDWRDELRRINGRKPTRKELTGLGDNDTEKWFTDERIAENQQLPDKFFTKDGTNFDKGHIVRRDDVCWGTSFKDIQKANGDTYHTTNCSPQISEFNQAAQGKDNWGDLENLVQHETDAERAIVFAGPVLSKHDQRFEGVDEKGEVLIQIPSKFWKIIVTKGDDGPQAFGFVLEQDLSQVPLEFAVPAPWRRFMRKIEDIEGMLFGLAKLDAIQPFDQFDKLRGRRVTSRMRR